MKSILCLAILLIVFFPTSAQNLLLTGKIGKYDIEMQITDSDWELGSISGKYRYQSKTKFLQLSGNIMDNCFHLVEKYNGIESGEFFLQKVGDSLTGRWLDKAKYFNVALIIKSGDTSLLKSKQPINFESEVSNAIYGTYKNASYFLNDMWLSDDNLEMEIAFNGGYAIIEQISADSIQFQVSVVCGPTYHIAMAEGIAVKSKTGPEYIFSIKGYSTEDSCLIYIVFGEKTVNMRATGGFTCGFGARAYLDHTFLKTTDKVKFIDDF